MPYNASTNQGTKVLDILPDECPHCHKSVTPRIISGLAEGHRLEVFFSCPNEECKRAFIGEYIFEAGNHWNYIHKVSQGTFKGRDFNGIIREISPMFIEIYNQSLGAENANLNEISGVGYRKALEFLIKDYLVGKDPESEDKIKKMALGNCIKQHVDDVRLKTVAKRAVWLGNDETHYLRKWEGKDLKDLKKLIDLTVHWIEMEKLTESFEVDMPE